MSSLIFEGEVGHYRTGPKAHKFNYPVYFYSFDLDEIAELNSYLFGYNCFRPVSIYDKDYLTEGEEPIKEKVKAYLKSKNIQQEVEKIYLITSARYFGYVFNPVNFYYCYSSQGELTAHIAEVNNTFGERHIYLLTKDVEIDAKNSWKYLTPKDFHVSPFYNMTGDYEFDFSKLGSGFEVKIDVIRDGKKDFYSYVRARKTKSFSQIKLLQTLLKFPLTASLTYPRIIFEAIKMYYLKRLPVFRKPRPVSENTIKAAKPNLIQVACLNLIDQLFNNFKYGHLRLILPDGSVKEYGRSFSDYQAEIQVNHFDFFRWLVFDGAIGFGEAYTENLWETDNLPAVIEFFIANKQTVEHKSILLKLLAAIKEKSNYYSHCFRANNIKGARKNISAHYDLSNELFELFLDSSMTYSSAVYTSRDQSLEDAQQNKINAIIKDARITASDHVLEIGSGWGALAVAMAKQTGCKVTSITLSKEQLKVARERALKEQVADRVDFQLCDYRKMQGQYNKIVSIEMIEAIGKKNYQSYFEAIERLLMPNGLVFIQAITVPDQHFKKLSSRCDWIQKHIFPGSLLPSLEAIQNAATKYSQLVVENLENIGPSYALTLAEWRERFNRHQANVLAMGFDHNFINAWNYYLAYCEAAFATRTLNVLQLTMTRSFNQNLISQDFRIPESNEYGSERVNQL